MIFMHCSTDALVSMVSVLVIDCILTGHPPPSGTDPISMVSDLYTDALSSNLRKQTLASLYLPVHPFFPVLQRYPCFFKLIANFVRCLEILIILASCLNPIIIFISFSFSSSSSFVSVSSFSPRMS